MSWKVSRTGYAPMPNTMPFEACAAMLRCDDTWMCVSVEAPGGGGGAKLENL